MNKTNSISLLAVAAFAVVSAGCGSNLCDRASKSVSGKSQACSDQQFVGLGSRCASSEASCPGGDQKILEDMVTCFEKVPACVFGDEASFQSRQSECYANADNLSATCRDALFEGGVIPRPGTVPDAGSEPGPQPDVDGGGAMDLIAVADESSMAVAWTQKQSGFVTAWEVHSKNPSDARFPVVSISDQSTLFYTLTDVGTETSRFFFTRGVGPDGGIVLGTPPGGIVDAGAGCASNSDCPSDKICQITNRTCARLGCASQSQCPTGYICDTATTFQCYRQSADGGTAVITPDSGTPEPQRPLLSEQRQLTVGPASYAERAASPFGADEDPDLVGIDSARQVISIQQFGQIFAHVTEDRGRSWRTVLIDPIGQRPHVTYNKVSRQLFFCYQAAGAVRVRSSQDLGKTFMPSIAEIALPTPNDGGTALPIGDCDIAPWRNGGAMVSVIEQDRIANYEISSGVGIVAREVAYINDDASDGGITTVFNAQRPAIATLPDEFIVHVAFQGTRNLSGGGTDKDIYAVYRDPVRTSGTFSPRMRLTGGAVTGQGQNLEQRDVSIALEPGTGRALATFQSEDSTGTGGSYQSAYLSLFTKVGNNPWSWGTGSDLSVFAKNSAGAYAVIPDRPPVGAVWNAISPSVTFTGKNQAILTFGASQQGDPLKIWTVGFDFNATSALGGNLKGWFVPPAVKVSTTNLVDLGPSTRAGPVISGDQQISSYITFIEGVGAGGQVANRPLLLARPQQ